MGKFLSQKWMVIPKPKNHPQAYTYEELYAEYWPILHKLYTQHIQDPWDAEDLTQIVMGKLWYAFDGIVWDKVSGFIGKTANNVKADYIRKSIDLNSTVFLESFMEIDHHDEGFSDPLRLLVIDRAGDIFQKLSEDFPERDILLFLDSYTENLTPDELCKKYNVKKKHTYVIKYRVKEKLLNKLSETDLFPEED